MSSLLLVICFLGPLFVALGVMKIWIALKRREGKHFPFKDTVIREPGYGQRKAVERVWDELSQYLFLLPVYPLVMYTVILQSRVTQGHYSPVLIGICVAGSVAVIGVSLFKIWRLLATSHCLRLGYAGEVIVGQALNQLMLQGYHVFHDVPFDGFNVDHVVIGPGGVFVVETKLRTKRIATDKSNKTHKVRFDGKALYFPDHPTVPVTKALDQARDEARDVSRWLSNASSQPVTAQAVLVLPSWWITGVNKQGKVWVFNHNQLYRLLPDSKTVRLDPQRLCGLVAACKAQCARTDLVPQVLKPKANPLFQES